MCAQGKNGGVGSAVALTLTHEDLPTHMHATIKIWWHTRSCEIWQDRKISGLYPGYLTGYCVWMVCRDGPLQPIFLTGDRVQVVNMWMCGESTPLPSQRHCLYGTGLIFPTMVLAAFDPHCQ